MLTSTIIIIILVLILFYIMIKNKNKNKKMKNNFKNKINNNNNIKIYYFYAEWCPHCKNFKTEWDKFVKLCNNDIYNNIIITTINNCDNKELCEKFNITGYPSIVIEYKNSILQCDKRNGDEIYNYILNILNY